MIGVLSNEPVNGRWLLTGIAGSGSSSVVYRAYDLVAEEVVAVKALTRGRSSWLPEERARREFLDLAQLRHPNLVETYEFARSESGPLPGGTPFFTMELLEAPATGWAAPEPRSLARLALGLLAGLGCVHSHGLVHRDVKPSNVLLDSRRTGSARFKLSDLGLAAPSSRRRGGLQGTLQYASPEAIAGERVDPRSDLYSLGVLLYEVATGGLPYDEADPAAALRWHLGKRTFDQDSASALSPTLARVLRRLIDPRPPARYANAHEAWEAVAESVPDEPAPDGNPGGEGDGPFMGRREERSALAGWLETSWKAGGHCQILGTRGSGLSRFAREAALIGQGKGWSVHATRCAPGAPPFLPFFRPLREILLRGSVRGRPAGAAFRGRIAERDLLRLLGGPALWEVGGRALGTAVEPLAAALAGFLAANPPGRPLMIVLDDFDSADPSVLAVARRVDERSRWGAPCPLLVTAAHAEHGNGRGRVSRSGGVLPDDLAASAGVSDPGRRRSAWRAGLAAAGSTRQGAKARPRATDEGRGMCCELRLGTLSPGASQALLKSLPCASVLTPCEAREIVRAAEGIPGRLVRLARAASGRQRPLFPPLYEPRPPEASNGYRCSATSG